MRQLLFLQQLGNDFGVLDRRRADQHRLPALEAFADVGNRGVVLFLGGLVHAVELVVALAGLVGRDDHGLETVDVLEFVGLGVGRAGHARQLVVQAKVVLERDGGQRLVLGLDRHAFLGFHRLVQAIGPAAAAHQAAGEFVDDDDLGPLLALLHHVMLVTVVHVVRAQGGVQVVHQRDVGRVVQAGAFGDQPALGQDALGGFVPLFGQVDLVRLLVGGEIARLGDAQARARVGLALLPRQRRHDGVHGDVQRRVVFGLAADDERRARLVDQDRIHLIDDGVVELALHAVAGLIDHVVAQVVEAELVVGAVGDVGVVGLAPLSGGHRGEDHRGGQAEEVVQAPHLLGLVLGQVVVDRDDVDALAGQRIQVRGQRGGQGLALTGFHLGDVAQVQCRAAHQLDVEVALAEHALGGLAHRRERLGQDGVQRLAVLEARAKLVGLGAQLLVAHRLVVGLDGVHLLGDRLQALDLAPFTQVHQLVQQAHVSVLPRRLAATGSAPPPW